MLGCDHLEEPSLGLKSQPLCWLHGSSLSFSWFGAVRWKGAQGLIGEQLLDLLMDLGCENDGLPKVNRL